MSSSIGAKAQHDGLQISIDAANIKSLPYQPQPNDHGISDWFCFYSGNATYCIVNSNVSIYERNGSIVTKVVQGTANPQRGTLPVVAGRFYFGDGPFHMFVEDGQHMVAPLSMAGKIFAHAGGRGNPGYYNIFALADAKVNLYNNTVNGAYGTPTSTIYIPANTFTQIPVPATTWYFLSSTAPILVTADYSGSDKSVITPASPWMYNRMLGWNYTANATVPTTQGSCVVYDTTYPVVNFTIADGSGGDSANGLGLQHLCDRYCWGNALSDYQIVTPYDCTITTSYWDGSAWVVWDTHIMGSSAINSPNYVARDGNSGPGVAAGTLSGVSGYMAGGAIIWKWEGTQPFFLCINDTADDEEAMLGWMSTRTTRQSDYPYLYETSGKFNSGIFTTGTLYQNKTIYFDGVDDRVIFDAQTIDFSGGGSMEITFKAVDIDTRAQGIMSFNGDGGSFINFYFGGLSKIRHECIGTTGQSYSGVAWYSTAVLQNAVWYHVVGTWDANGNRSLYINGKLDSTNYHANVVKVTRTAALNLGNYAGYFKGNLGLFKMYNQCLSASQIADKFAAVRGRYSI